MKLAFSLPKDNSFSIYLNQFVNLVIDKYPKMTINGLTGDDMYNLSQGIHMATKGSVIVIDNDNHYDIDWYPSKERAQRAGISNIYSIDSDWGTIKNFLKMYNDKNYVFQGVFSGTKEEKPSFLYAPDYYGVYELPYGKPSSEKIIDTGTFVKVGNKIYPKYPVSDNNTTTLRIRIKRSTPSYKETTVRGFGLFSIIK